MVMADSSVFVLPKASRRRDKYTRYFQREHSDKHMRPRVLRRTMQRLEAVLGGVQFNVRIVTPATIGMLRFVPAPVFPQVLNWVLVCM